jgi:hypothetical protein
MFGLDYLAGAKYGDIILKEHPKGWAAGFFDTTFGDAYPVVSKLAQSKRCPLIRIHLLWDDNHTFGEKQIEAAFKSARRYQELATRVPIAIELSLFCEHNLKDPDVFLDRLQMIAPNCRIINTPLFGAKSKKYKNEIHNDDPPPTGPYNFSFDGLNCVDTDIEMFKLKHSRSDVFFFWHPRFNLKWSMKDATPRPKRRAKPSKEFVKSIIYLSNSKGRTNPPPKMVKSHAEKHGPTDQKGDKLLLILNVKADKIELVTPGGKPVATLPFYGNFEGGGYRYYANSFGYQIAEKAQKLGGSPFVRVFANGKRIGLINPAFRDREYRNKE